MEVESGRDLVDLCLDWKDLIGGLGWKRFGSRLILSLSLKAYN